MQTNSSSDSEWTLAVLEHFKENVSRWGTYTREPLNQAWSVLRHNWTLTEKAMHLNTPEQPMNQKPIETSELAYKYERGASAAELAAEYQISKVAILNRLRQVGITIRGRGARAGGQTTVKDLPPLAPPPLGLRHEEYP